MLFDESLALAKVGGDRRLFSELTGLFLMEYPALLRAIRGGLEDGDLVKAADSAHQIKGLLAQFAAEPARLAAADLEWALRQSDTTRAWIESDRLANIMRDLEPLLKAVRESTLL